MNETTKRLIVRLLYAPKYPRDMLYCWSKGLRWNPSWRLYGLPFINRHRLGRLVIGQRFTACSDSRRNILGVFQKVIIHVGKEAEVVIGDDVGVSGCTISAQRSVRIGDRVLVGSGCLITDSDAHPLHPDDRRYDGSKTVTRPIVIENDVFIGARAIVLKGVRIGQGSVVGAGAVVTRDVLPMTVVAGNPACEVKKIDARGSVA